MVFFVEAHGEDTQMAKLFKGEREERKDKVQK